MHTILPYHYQTLLPLFNIVIVSMYLFHNNVQETMKKLDACFFRFLVLKYNFENVECILKFISDFYENYTKRINEYIKRMRTTTTWKTCTYIFVQNWI